MLPSSHIWPVGAPSSWLLCFFALACLSLSTVLLLVEMFQALPVLSSQSPGLSPFTKDLCFFALGSDIRILGLEAGCAHCLGDVFARGLSDWGKKLFHLILLVPLYAGRSFLPPREPWLPTKLTSLLLCSFLQSTPASFIRITAPTPLGTINLLSRM